MQFRPHCSADYAAIARLRWLLNSEDAATIAGADFERFAADYQRHLAERDIARDTVHWVAEDAGKLVGVMTLRQVAKEPSPSSGAGSIGYLTNCYVRPEHRNRGVGAGLLNALVTQARDDGMELLVVWPSERAYPFYRRAGFAGESDPLALMLNADD